MRLTLAVAVALILSGYLSVRKQCLRIFRITAHLEPVSDLLAPYYNRERM